MPHPDVVIIGAGLAGLNCARHLQERGLSYTLVDADAAVGGRVRTDVQDGFRLDRGFQVLLTAYPETRAALDYEALDLKPFYAGALVRQNGRFWRVADPFRHPADALHTLVAPVGTLADKLRVAWLRWGVLQNGLSTVFARPEIPTIDALRLRWHFSDAMIDAFFRPFLGGILLDRDLQASSRMFEFVFRMFSKGDTAVPAEGMEAIPRHLAADLDEAAIRLDTRVAAVEPGLVTLDGGEVLEARAIVVATEAPEAARLLDGRRIPARPCSTVNLYYAAEQAPLDEPILVLGDGQPINNLIVLSNAAPSYAPPGAHLISVSVVGLPDRPDEQIERDVRAQMTAWFGAPVRGWQHLRTYRIPYALPDQRPPFLTPPERPVRLGDGLYICGDHRRTGSINGAMASGRHAAAAVATELAVAT